MAGSTSSLPPQQIFAGFPAPPPLPIPLKMDKVSRAGGGARKGKEVVIPSVGWGGLILPLKPPRPSSLGGGVQTSAILHSFPGQLQVFKKSHPAPFQSRSFPEDDPVDLDGMKACSILQNPEFKPDQRLGKEISVFSMSRTGKKTKMRILPFSNVGFSDKTPEKETNPRGHPNVHPYSIPPQSPRRDDPIWSPSREEPALLGKTEEEKKRTRLDGG